MIVVSDHGMASFKERFSLSKQLEDRAQLFIGGWLRVNIVLLSIPINLIYKMNF